MSLNTFFGKRDPVTKLSLLKAHCSSFYGSVVWDLLHSSIDAFCAVWRKGLRRIWNLPHNTHCALLPLLRESLPLMDDLACRCAKFICSCLYSESDVVKFVARYILVGQSSRFFITFCICQIIAVY